MSFSQRIAALTAAVLLTGGLSTLGVAPAFSATDPSSPPPPVEVLDGAPVSDHEVERGSLLENAELRQSKGLSSPLGDPGTRSGNIKVTLVTVNLADRSGSGISSADARNAIDKSSDYWQSMSHNRISMSVAATRYEHRSAARSTWNYSDIMNKVTSELGWKNSPYTALVVFVPTSTLSGGALGYGWSGTGTGGRILMPQPSNFTGNTMTHEFGHLLGLMHSDALECAGGESDIAIYAGSGCYVSAYGDTLDLMGYSRYNDTPVISSSFWDTGKFGRGNEVLNAGVASGRKSYTLTPWAGGAANRAVKFTDPNSGETYYLELRTPTGFDRNVAVGGNRGVKVVQSGGATAASSIVLRPNTLPFYGFYNPNLTWQAGQTFRTHSGTTVRIDSVSNTSARVTVDTGSTFSDISGSGFQTDINWMYAKGLSTGWSDGTYRPFASMSREAMAAFMYRLAGRPAFTPPARSPFKDVSTQSLFYKEITWMQSRQLTTGWSDGTYRPSASISRDAMAAFLHRYTADFCNVSSAAAFDPPRTSPFRDVSTESQFYTEIAWMKNSRISTGWNDGTYRELAPITREAMAAFIHRLDAFQVSNGGCRS